MKIVINKCYGGFSISRECAEYMRSLGSEDAANDLSSGHFHGYGPGEGYKRNDPFLVKAVEDLGSEKTSGKFAAELKVIEIPDNIEWKIEEYDGVEWVAEVHNTWG